MKHLMIDLETMGTLFNAPVLAIGAVFFDPETGELGETFYGGIDVEDACRYGKPSGSTIKWWMKQGDEARAAAIAGTSSSADVFGAFMAFVQKGGKNVKPWGNGATFDISMLEFAFARVLDKTQPWEFWNVRDCRTIKEIGELVSPFRGERQGTHHQSLDDAIFQAQWVSHYWQALRGREQAITPVAAVGEPEDLLA